MSASDAPSGAPSAASQPQLSARAGALAHGFGEVWNRFTPLARDSGAVNLGQGFPNWPAPSFVKAAAAKCIHDDLNQYAPSVGSLALRKTLQAHYTRVLKRPVDLAEVIVTGGATEAMYLAMQCFVNPGDEVVVFEPFFDNYIPQALLAGARLRYVPLVLQPTPADAAAVGAAARWVFDENAFRSVLSDKTKLVVLNSPHNPCGKVFSEDELMAIASILVEYPQVQVVSDEVYEHMVYPDEDGHRHSIVQFATACAKVHGFSVDRCITVSSAGKTFSVTGWKIGWAVASPAVIRAFQAVHQAVTWSIATPLQEAMVSVLEQAAIPYEGCATYFEWLATEYGSKRQFLAEALTAAGLTPLLPQGGFFILVDVGEFTVPASWLKSQPPDAAIHSRPHDWQFCEWLTQVVGVAAIPSSPFISGDSADLRPRYARFAFCKTADALEMARTRLLRFQERLAAKQEPSS